MHLMIHGSPLSGGDVTAVASKSIAHRALITAALSDRETTILLSEKNRDIRATADCLSALGASITEIPQGYLVLPITTFPPSAVMDCGESGTTYRFMLSLAAALGTDAGLIGHGRLPQRPLSPLYETLSEHGVMLSPHGSNPLSICGVLNGTEFSFSGNVSSQYASGLLLAFPLLACRMKKAITLTLTGKIESLPYLELTRRVMECFGVSVSEEWTENGSLRFTVPSNARYVSPGVYHVEGDYSSAAFFLVAGAIGKRSFTVKGLDLDSPQGDRAILSLLRSFGANVSVSDHAVTVSPASLHGISIDASQIPDLVPILAVLASAAEGDTRIYNAARLRLKESDRLETVSRLISSLGGSIEQHGDELLIHGTGILQGGTADAENDHRIAMSAAIASLITEKPVTILGAECAEKSYSRFYEDAKLCGLTVTEVTL